MYKEGEDRFLKDLDCVNIVKSIRELKALTRIILNQQQRQILAFERESVLPSSKYLQELEVNQIQNKVPFEYGSEERHQLYYEELESLVENYSNKVFSNIDHSIIEELVDETKQSIPEITAQSNSIIGNYVITQNHNKWE